MATQTPSKPARKARKARKAKAKTNGHLQPLSAAEARWVRDHARPALSLCLCGCGGESKTRFVPGHDAQLKSRLAKTAEGKGAAAKDARDALATFGW